MMSGNKSPAVSIPETPGATAKVDAIAFYKAVTGAVRTCDTAGSGLADAGKSGDLVSLYQAADAMESACLSTSSDIQKIDIPSSVGTKAYDEFSKARDACENAYLARWSAAGKMKEALNDAGSVSRQAELRTVSQASQAGVLLCVAGLVGTTSSLGVTAEELGISK